MKDDHDRDDTRFADREAVVFDLDGTLVRLAVDWEAAAADVAEVLRRRGITPPDDELWAMIHTADAAGHREAVEHVISEYERIGARESDRLPAADTIPGVPVGICSLNCEDACRIALEVHAIDGVDVIVGRDSVEAMKPDPGPLLETVHRLEADPEEVVFVGDSHRDEQTADRAGVDYVFVSEWLRAYR